MYYNRDMDEGRVGLVERMCLRVGAYVAATWRNG